MSFGVSIGDVLLITKIGFTLWVNISGAKEEREDLLANLMEWKDKLESIEPMITDHVGMSPHDVKNAKKKFSEALATLHVLEELNRKLVKGRAFRRAAWEVKGRATFLEYQTKLEKKIDAIEKLFTCASMCVNLNPTHKLETLRKGAGSIFPLSDWQLVESVPMIPENGAGSTSAKSLITVVRDWARARARARARGF